MNLFENIVLALTGLRAGKMRSLLTMLGIIIGIGSVIGIVTVGDALGNSVTGSLQTLGVNNITVFLQQKGTQAQTDRGITPDANDLVTDDMLVALQDRYSSQIEAITINQSAGTGEVRKGRHKANVTLTSVNPGYSITNSTDMLKGRFINERDLRGEKMVAVVSDKMAASIFGKNGDPLGQEIQVNLPGSIQTFTVVGVYKAEDTGFGQFTMVSEDEAPTNLFFPISAYTRVTGNQLDGYQGFQVTAKPKVDTQALSVELEEEMAKYYEKNPRFQISAISMETMLAQVNTIMGTLSTAVAVIASISLLVGGIGVMNIMLVSVTERTREIGTRKALGAQNSAIRAQFIIESMILCLIGGSIGIVVGLVLGALGSALLAAPAEPSVPAIILAVGFSMGIGVFFGYYPANKAAKMDPIEALRYE